MDWNLTLEKTIITTNIFDNKWSFLGADIVKLRKSPSFLRMGVGGERLLVLYRNYCTGY